MCVVGVDQPLRQLVKLSLKRSNEQVVVFHFAAEATAGPDVDAEAATPTTTSAAPVTKFGLLLTERKDECLNTVQRLFSAAKRR